jgi:diphthine-ammonia ligase
LTAPCLNIVSSCERAQSCGRIYLIQPSIETEHVIHSDNDFATVAYLRVKEATLEEKTETSTNGARVPALIEEDIEGIKMAVCGVGEHQVAQVSARIGATTLDLAAVSDEINSSQRTVGPWVATGNVQSIHTSERGARTVEEEVIECFRQLEGAWWVS